MADEPALGRPLRGTAKRGAGLLFGRVLEDAVKSTRAAGAESELHARLIPAFVLRSVQHLNKYGVDEEGLFRITGRSSHVARLRAEFDAGADYDLARCPPSDLDPHAVSSALKAYLRELPEPILTRPLGALFEEAIASTKGPAGLPSGPGRNVRGYGVGLPSGPKRPGVGLPGAPRPSAASAAPLASASPSSPAAPSPVRPALAVPDPSPLHQSLKGLVMRLPKENRDLLLTICELLAHIASHSRTNKMPMTNLLVVLGPSLNMNTTLLRVMVDNRAVIFQEDSASPARIPTPAPVQEQRIPSAPSTSDEQRPVPDRPSLDDPPIVSVIPAEQSEDQAELEAEKQRIRANMRAMSAERERGRAAQAELERARPTEEEMAQFKEPTLDEEERERRAQANVKDEIEKALRLSLEEQMRQTRLAPPSDSLPAVQRIQGHRRAPSDPKGLSPSSTPPRQPTPTRQLHIRNLSAESGLVAAGFFRRQPSPSPRPSPSPSPKPSLAIDPDAERKMELAQEEAANFAAQSEDGHGTDDGGKPGLTRSRGLRRKGAQKVVGPRKPTVDQGAEAPLRPAFRPDLMEDFEGRPRSSTTSSEPPIRTSSITRVMTPEPMFASPVTYEGSSLARSQTPSAEDSAGRSSSPFSPQSERLSTDIHGSLTQPTSEESSEESLIPYTKPFPAPPSHIAPILRPLPVQPPPPQPYNAVPPPPEAPVSDESVPQKVPPLTVKPRTDSLPPPPSPPSVPPPAPPPHLPTLPLTQAEEEDNWAALVLTLVEDPSPNIGTAL